ncbi:murein L,D-transpeptidase [bacterium]|nr:MAG: murein L,D-transpeptidase [bacterium]
MNTKILEARRHIAGAREALQRGDKETAWHRGQQAALLAPEMEDVWLVLIASDPNPKQALAYARRALAINPKSSRARRGWEWAQARMEEQKSGRTFVKQSMTASLSLKRAGGIAGFPQPLPDRRRNCLYPVLLAGAGFLLVGLLGMFVLARPVLASIASAITAAVPTQEILWAPADIAKPVVTPLDVSVFGSEERSADVTPSGSSAIPALPEPDATATPGTMAMEIVKDDAPSLPDVADSEQSQYPVMGRGERWIDVNLSEQRVYAYEGEVVVNSFLVSTGVAQTPTVTGEYKIYVKVRIQDMSGPGYYLQDVPWVMFFYDEYGFHGTYWHNNFGTPMSRGCVNLTVDDAAWLYNWASVGTIVDVHY